jgi:hypothetical protein
MRLRATFTALLASGVLGTVGLSSVGAADGASANSSLALSAPAAHNLVRNGGFETPAISRPWKPFFAHGKRRIPGWRVLHHSVDLVRTDWPAGRGRQSLGVNGFRKGWVFQTVPTDANAAYRLSFLLWGDPNGPPPRSRLEVRWDLKRVRVLKVDVRTQHKWRRISFVVHSTTAGTSLGFHSLTPGNAGPAIDAVRLARVL